MYTRCVLPSLWTFAGCGLLPGSGASDPPDDVVVTPPRPRIESPGAQPAPPAADEPPIAVVADNCQDLADGGPVAGPDCLTGEVRCGEVLYGHTLGGTTGAFTSRFYEKKACTPATTNHDGGGERAYALRMPDGEHHVDVWLDTPCADLDLAVMEVKDVTRCPVEQDYVARCDMWPKPSNKREHVELSVQGATDFLVVVEGKKAQDGAFALTVLCGEGLY